MIRRLPFRTDVWVLALVAAQPLESAVRIGGGGVLTITKLLGVVCLGAFVLDWAATRRRLVVDPSHALVVLLLAISLLSAVQASSESTAFTVATRYAGFVVLYVIVTQFVGEPDLQRRIVWVLSIAGSVAGALALANFVSGRALRVTPSYGDPNDLAYMLAATLPLTAWLLTRRTSRALAATMFGVMLAATVLTLSRGALIALAAGAAWFVVTERRYRVLAGSAVVLIIASALVFGRSDNQRIGEAIRVKERVASSNVENRLHFWRVAVGLANDHPLLGVGPGNFPLYLYSSAGQPQEATTYVVHDAYLEVAAEVGIPALALFLLFIGMAFTRASRAVALRAGAPGLAVAVRTALVVAIVGAVPLSEQYYAPLWLLGGLATLLWSEIPVRVTEGSDARRVRVHA
jgi:putative inorganic carbon (hco3(-)) transporter